MTIAYTICKYTGEILKHSVLKETSKLVKLKDYGMSGRIYEKTMYRGDVFFDLEECRKLALDKLNKKLNNLQKTIKSVEEFV